MISKRVIEDLRRYAKQAENTDIENHKQMGLGPSGNVPVSVQYTALNELLDCRDEYYRLRNESTKSWGK